ncbi:MAG: hypothetical protein QF554_03255 [Dehalococcoidia bacterium]|nr:hypothetical protein [Dehalococcoidia bacterium]
MVVVQVGDEDRLDGAKPDACPLYASYGARTTIDEYHVTAVFDHDR